MNAKEAKEAKKRDRYYSNELILPPECDALCRFRGCYNKYEDKGNYTAGRGYTRYHITFQPCCGTRLSHGCGDGRKSYDMAAALKWCAENISDQKRRKAVKAVLEAMISINQK